MENKQTSIEWFVSQLPLRIQNSHATEIEKAKQMHKEQIEEAYWASYKEGQYSGDKTAEEYYKETYGKQDNGK